MMIVYKYYPWNEFTVDALNKGYFFFCKAAKQNDPYDCSFKLIEGTQLAKHLIDNKIIHPESERIMADYGTCSFSEVKDNMHLWAFYAEKFNGIVIGYEDKTFESITKDLLARIGYYEVTYLSNIIDVDNPNTKFVLKEINNKRCATINDCFKGDRKKDDDFFAYLCSIKAEDTWREERERRLIAAGDIMNGRARLEKNGVEYFLTGIKYLCQVIVLKK